MTQSYPSLSPRSKASMSRRINQQLIVVGCAFVVLTLLIYTNSNLEMKPSPKDYITRQAVDKDYITGRAVDMLLEHSNRQIRIDFDKLVTDTKRSVVESIRQRKTKGSTAALPTNRSGQYTINSSSSIDIKYPDGRKCYGCLQETLLVGVNKDWICGHPRLGNKMSMLVPAIAATTNFGAKLVLIEAPDNCPWNRWLQELFEYFNSTAPVIPESISSKWLYLGQGQSSSYNPIKSKPSRNFTVAGYKQNWRYAAYDAQKGEVRRVFNFTSRYRQYATRTLSNARKQFHNLSKPVQTVGVHMRIGDLMEDNPKNFGYQMANREFYNNALGNASAQLDGSMLFIVGTDSRQEALKILGNLTAKYNIMFLDGSDFEDFAVLSYCDHMITSGGTYGWWAAWLTDGKVFYHSNFARYGSKYAKEFSNENFYPPEWIAIDSNYPSDDPDDPDSTKVTVNPIPEVILPCNRCLEGKELITVQFGWLCNSAQLTDKMSMLASSIATTATYNTSLVFYQYDVSNCAGIDVIQDVFPYFRNNVPLVNYRITENWETVGEAYSTEYNPKVYIPGKNISHAGYRQNWKYVQTAGELKAVNVAFKLANKYTAYAIKEKEKASKHFKVLNNSLFIGVHARVLNLEQNSSKEYGYNMAFNSFYQKSLDAAQRLFQDRDIIFMVVSDNIDVAKILLHPYSKVYNIFYSSGSENKDLAVLSSCEHSIITGGTFGYWGALLSGGTTFYFSEFATPGTEFAKTFKNENFFRQEWIPIGN